MNRSSTPARARRIQPQDSCAAPACVAVAYSGGRDSSALLHATLAAAGDLGIAVVALHVHHGLMADADAWLSHCERQCRRWARRGSSLAFDHRRLDGKPARGESVEAWARRERYAALREMAVSHRASAVLLAHHRLDQAETVLLQALRGAGVAGLAAMPEAAVRDGITWLRPWLGVDPAQIGAYVRRHRIGYVDDTSNADPRFARSRLRMQVWPALSAAFPDAQQALASSAAWAQEARACAEALAAIDLDAISDGERLDLDAFSALPAARRSNALRAWIRERTGEPATAAEAQRLLDELPASRAPGRWPLGGFELRRYRARLAAHRIGTDAVRDGATARPAQTLAVTRAGDHVLDGWGGVLRATRVRQGGVPLAKLAKLQLVQRCGGEQFQSAPDRPPRSLKKQYQARGVPAWARQGPLLYCGDELIFVPGLGIDARAVAPPGQAQLLLAWIADPG